MKLLLASTLVAAAGAVGSSPGHGLSKSTYATTDPIPGRVFMTKYLPCAEAPDDCAGAVCTCTTDGSDWTIQQGRVQLNEESGGREHLEDLASIFYHLEDIDQILTLERSFGLNLHAHLGLDDETMQVYEEAQHQDAPISEAGVRMNLARQNSSVVAASL